MSADIIRLDVVTKLDLPPERVLADACAADLESVVIIGFDKAGEEYFTSSIADGADVVWLLERAKLRLLRYADGDRE